MEETKSFSQTQRGFVVATVIISRQRSGPKNENLPQEVTQKQTHITKRTRQGQVVGARDQQVVLPALVGAFLGEEFAKDALPIAGSQQTDRKR